ncbi:CRISPR system precrRNA processing endoribonuclease RAMP protein Cas6 [Spirulina major]|uniref:CRISPR system precrRNA processing endoribonuclease RAMP protein Cas6 n=1 Tax=Spirulina major TaxID=270636 RepID=UPI001114C3EF|nr:CRISPR system precrRNA processing endoribonuclease RAMP protein Cas6 [Spirulina major]
MSLEAIAYSVVVELAVAKTRSKLPLLSHALHAQVLAWIALADANLAKQLHMAQVSPLSISPLRGKSPKRDIKAGDRVYFRVGILASPYAQALLSGIEQWGDRALTLNNHPFQIVSVLTLPGSHILAGATPYALLHQTQAVTTLTLAFQSPTSFKQGNNNIQPLPLPELVFGGLQRRWNAFAPEALRFERIEWHGWVSAYTLKTHRLTIKNSTQIGAQGQISYEFRDPVQAKRAAILAQFAFFAGVGRKTALGMGQCQSLST